MASKIRTLTAVTFTLFILSMGISQAFAEGDEKDNGPFVNYTCRIGNGDIIDTTYKSVAEDSKKKKARVFLLMENYEPASLDTQYTFSTADNELKFFKETLLIELSKAVKGWEIGKKGTVTVSTEDQKNVPENEKTITLSRIKKHPKETRYEKDSFMSFTGAKPVIGESVSLIPEINGKVTAVDGSQVTVTFAPAPKTVLESASAFGPVTVTDQGEEYIIEIDSREGTLVRVGPLVGRISKVTEDYFEVDYGQAFGGEKLTCDVQIAAGKPQASAKAGEADEKVNKDEKIDVSEISKKLAAIADEQTGRTEKEQSPSVETPGIAQAGDLVEVDYTITLEDGRLVVTTLRSVAEDAKLDKVEGFTIPEKYLPESIVAGQNASVPGVGDAVLGMAKGVKKEIMLPPENAYGIRDSAKFTQFSRERTLPVKTTLTSDEYYEQFKGFPVKGKVIEYNEYVKGAVTEVTDSSVSLDFSPKLEKQDLEFGTVTIETKGDKIRVYLTPKLGAAFEYNNVTGKIISMDNVNFTVDLNDPMAGKTIKLSMEVVSIAKASSFANQNITWIEDHDKGLAEAVQENKPTVLVLYADWCQWCKKLLDETMVDPRIKTLKDRFVWVKVDSDKNQDIKALYEQESFPTVVILSPKGTVTQKFTGYKDAFSFSETLRASLNSQVKVSALKK